MCGYPTDIAEVEITNAPKIRSEFRRRGIYLLPNLFTTAALFAGFYAIVMAIFLFSLVGLPPFAGFIGKLYLFQAIINKKMYSFAILAAINSVISLYYYVKIIKAMFLDAPEVKMAEGITPFDSRSSMAFLALLAIPNIILGLYWEPVFLAAQSAVKIFVR